MAKKRSKSLERVTQARYNPGDIDMTKPLDLTKFGSDDDPCFGKLYDLNAKQCKICGDADFCAVKMAQNQSLSRTELNKSNNFIEEFDVDTDELKLDTVTIKQIKKKMRSLIRESVKPIKIRSKMVKKFSITREQARSIYKSIK